MKLNPFRRMPAAIRAQADEIRDVVLAWGSALGVRGAGYQMVVQRGWEKTESRFDFVGRCLVRMRMTGEVPWDRIYDPGSEVRGGDTKVLTYDPLEEVKERLLSFAGYQTSWWNDQPAAVQTWLEKDGLLPTIQAVTDEFRVPLLSGGGTPSLTLQRNGFELLDAAKRNVVLQVFDFDASGNVMARDLEEKYAFWNEQEYEGKLSIEHVRVAITREQIRAWNLPTRPSKTGNTHSKSFTSKFSVELDAALPTRLQQALREAIEAVLEPVAWEAAKARQAALTREVRSIVRSVLAAANVDR